MKTRAESWWSVLVAGLRPRDKPVAGRVVDVRAATRQKAGRPHKIRRSDQAYILQNLATLVEHGVPLPKALETLRREKTLERHLEVIDGLRRAVESGEGLSKAMALYPGCFGAVVEHQVRIAERAGTLAETLARISEQLESSGQLRWQILRKLAYPLLLLGAGSVAVTFMLLFVVPVFEETYAASGVPLPGITTVLIKLGHWMGAYGWVAPLVLLVAIIAFRQARRVPATAERIDRALLKIPLVGAWLRNMIVLEFVEGLGNLLGSGFTIVEALRITSDSISNRAIRQSIESLQEAVQRGERFSSELERLGELFPPVVTQLVVIAERTGTLAETTRQIRSYLRKEIQRKTELVVGTLEPAMTIGLAVVIGTIVLAIYLPMFDMIGSVSHG